MSGAIGSDVSGQPAGPGRPAAVATTWMWEARAASGRADELLAWLLGALAASGLDAEVYRSTDQAADLVVAVVALSGGTLDGDAAGAGASALPQPPAELVERPPQGWAFARIR